MRNRGNHMKNGFTLIELLVVVLIIGVLVAIAWPMYQKAVLKSRFAALMPIAKAMADSNEAYYLEHGEYASDPRDLPVEGLSDYADGTQVDLVNAGDYIYTMVYNPNSLPDNNYIVFQNHSRQFAGTTLCEARDEQAEEVCASLGGTPLGGGITEGWISYLLSGESVGEFSSNLLAWGAPQYSSLQTSTDYGFHVGNIQYPQNGSLREINVDYSVGKRLFGYDDNNNMTVRAIYDSGGYLREVTIPQVGVVALDRAGNIQYISSEVARDGFAYTTYYPDGSIMGASKDGQYYYYYQDGTPYTPNAPDISSLPPFDLDSLSWLEEWKNK